MTLLVTGGAGFIGGNFVLDCLAHADETIVNLDKLTYAGNLQTLASLQGDARHVFVAGDIADTVLVQRLLAEHAPRAIVNFAAESHVDRSIDGPGDFIQTNVVGVFNLLQAARAYHDALPAVQQRAFRFLHVSTDEVYGALEPNDAPFAETHAYAPNSPYAASKAASDHLVRAWHHTYGLPVLTTNCSNNYGPFHFPEKLIPLVILKALAGERLPVYGDGMQVRDWLYVRDHCRAIGRVLEAGVPGQTYNIGGNSERTNLAVVHSLCALLDELRPRADGVSYALQIAHVNDRPGHDRRYAVDAGKIARELGWQPSETFESGLRKTVQWYLDNGDWIAGVTSGDYQGPSEKPERQAGAADRDGMQGANRSHSRSYGEDLQRRRPPEAADARGAVGYSESSKVKILLLGASGQLGVELRRSLALLGKLATPARTVCDLGDPSSLRHCVRAMRPDIIVNAAAWTDVEAAERAPTQALVVNGDGPAVLAQEAHACRALLVHYSSDYVFDGRLGRPYVETDVPKPLSAYGRSKLAGDEAARQVPRHLILRTGWLYSVHRSNFLKTLLGLMRQRAQVDVIVDQLGTPTSAELVADVTAHMLARYLRYPNTRADFAFGTYHVAASGHTHWHGYACEIAAQARAAGLPLALADDGIRAIATSAWLSPVVRPADSRLDTTRVRETFGLHLPPWQDGVQRTALSLGRSEKPFAVSWRCGFGCDARRKPQG